MRELSCEVAVVGAGPAGLAAAAEAWARGAEVLVLDEQPSAGGQIWRQAPGKAPVAALRRLRERCQGVRFEHGSAVFDGLMASGSGGSDVPLEAGAEAQRSRSDPSARRAGAGVELSLWSARGGTARLRAGALVLATGASELFLPFPGWTLPGVLGAGGLQALVKGGLSVRGKRVLVAGSGPLLLAVAAGLRAAGAEIVAILEQAPRAALLRLGLGLWRNPDKLWQAGGLYASLLGIPMHNRAWIRAVEGRGRAELVQAELAGRRIAFDVDYVACGFGLVPATQLGERLGAQRQGSGLVVDENGQTSCAGLFAAGEVTGIGGAPAAVAQGALAGFAAASYVLGPRAEDRSAWPRLRARVGRQRAFAAALARAFALNPALKQLAQEQTLLCRCEDVTLGRLRGYAGAREAKLATRCGMGPCQARVCGPVLEQLLGWSREVPRPPLFPVPLAALAEFGQVSAAPHS